MKKIIYLLLALCLLGFIFIFIKNHSANQNHQVKGPASSTNSNQDQTLMSTEQNTTPQPSSAIVSQEYHIPTDKGQLYGVLTAPEGYQAEKRPLIVIAHGFNNTLEMYEDYAQYFAKLGYLVYRFDFYGGSRQSKSGGQDMLDMSVLTQEADLTAVIQKLRQENFVDQDKISLLGVSQGGVVSTLYAADNPDTLEQLMLIFPAFVLFDDVKETYANLGVTNPQDLPAVITHRNTQLGSIYLTDALNLDIKAKMQAVKEPVLLIQGTDDTVVPYQYALDANQTFPQAQLVTVQGGGHWLDSNFNQVALPAMTDFLSKGANND